MNSIKRKLKILELINVEDSVKITQLTELFGISRVTARVDLDDLEEKGLVIRTRGGAMHPENIPAVRLLSKNLVEGQDAKKAICTEALKLIKPKMTIMIDGGSTLMYLARLVGQMSVTVVTNSFLVLDELKNSQSVEVFVAGGTLQRPYMALIDTTTSFIFEQIHADIFFMGSPGFTIERGASTRTTIDAEIKKQMIKSASTKCLLADSSKKDKMYMANICGWNDIDYFITDNLEVDDIERLSQKGVKVMLPNKPRNNDS
jgi:DeoR/GlpR family transcriptional regulator of sugar metabolism